MKKLINSSLFALCVLFGTSQASAMLKKCLKVAGLATGGIFGKKYVYDPLVGTPIKYKNHLAPQDVQELSNQLLDDHLKTHGGGLKKKLLVKYLKTFGCNRVYVGNFVNLFGQKRTNKQVAGTHHKGGIFISSHVKEDKNYFVEALGHETCHQYCGDVTCFKKKFPILLRAMPLLIKHASRNPKEMEEAGINQILSETAEMEFRTCRKNAKTLFYSGYFGPFCTFIKEIPYMPYMGAHASYGKGRLQGIVDIIVDITDGNLNHPLATNFMAYEEAVENVNQAVCNLEQVNRLQEQMNVKDEKLNHLLQIKLNANETKLKQVLKDLEATVKQTMDVNNTKIRDREV